MRGHAEGCRVPRDGLRTPVVLDADMYPRIEMLRGNIYRLFRVNVDILVFVCVVGCARRDFEDVLFVVGHRGQLGCPKSYLGIFLKVISEGGGVKRGVKMKPFPSKRSWENVDDHNDVGGSAERKECRVLHHALSLIGTFCDLHSTPVIDHLAEW